MIDEVRGIADGSEVKFREMLAFQLIDEVWAHGAQSAKDQGVVGCTSLGMTHEGISVVGQNMDLEQYRHGHQEVLRIVPDCGPRQLVLAQAGMVGLCGANEAGVSVVVNNLWQLSHSLQGLPVAFVVRGILACRTFVDACNFVESVEHASGQAYTVSGPRGEMQSWECSADGVTRLHTLEGSLPGSRAIVQANHPRSKCPHYSTAYRNLGSETGGREANSRARECVSCQLMSNTSSNSAIQTVSKDSLSLVMRSLCSRKDPANPVSRPLDPVSDTAFSFGSIIVRSSARTLHALEDGTMDHTFLCSLGPPFSGATGAYTSYKSYSFHGVDKEISTLAGNTVHSTEFSFAKL